MLVDLSLFSSDFVGLGQTNFPITGKLFVPSPFPLRSLFVRQAIYVWVSYGSDRFRTQDTLAVLMYHWRQSLIGDPWVWATQPMWYVFVVAAGCSQELGHRHPIIAQQPHTSPSSQESATIFLTLQSSIYPPSRDTF